MENEDREKLFAEISQALAERNLKPISSIAALGDASRGEIEITGIVAIHGYNKHLFTDIQYAVKFANGKTGAFTIRYNANGRTSDGAIIVALVNGLFVIVKEYRLPLGRWMHGVPRGFGEKIDAARIQGGLGTLKIGDLPLGTLTRELGEEVMTSAKVTSVTHLGNIAENSGISASTPSVFLVQISVPEQDLDQKLRGSEDLQELKVLLWDTATVKREVGDRLCDALTLSALLLAFKHIESLPRM